MHVTNSQREFPRPFSFSEIGIAITWTPTFYTDGSCAFPTIPGGGVAAFSVVVDILPPNSFQEDVALMLKDTGKLPDTLKPILIAQTPGLQSINRAELGAIICVIQSVDMAIIYSDSAWAIQAVQDVRDDPDFRSHWNRENADLIFLLCNLAKQKNLSNFDLRKIRSHQSDEDATSAMDLYHIFGNRCADLAANKGVQPAVSDFNKLAWSVATWTKQNIHLTKLVQEFLVRAYRLRLDAIQQRDSGNQHGRASVCTFEVLLDWTPTGFNITLNSELCEKVLKGFLPGASMLITICEWAATLTWPQDDNTTPGISFYELMCHCVGTTHYEIPTIVNKGEKYLHYVRLSDVPAAALIQTSPWDAVRILESAITYLKRYMGFSLFPENAVKAQKAYLAAFGYSKWVSGIKLRPALTHLLVHMQNLSTMITPQNLACPRPYDLGRVVRPSDHCLDATSFSDKLKQLKSLDYELRKKGQIVAN